MKTYSLLLVLLLAGCSSAPTYEVTADQTEVDCKPYPKPDPLVLKDVSPINRQDGWLFTHEDYKRLSDNMDSIVRYLTQVNTVYDYFVQCIHNHNKTIREAQAQPEPQPQPGLLNKIWPF